MFWDVPSVDEKKSTSKCVLSLSPFENGVSVPDDQPRLLDMEVEVCRLVISFRRRLSSGRSIRVRRPQSEISPSGVVVQST